jgi:hypothetical protein
MIGYRIPHLILDEAQANELVTIYKIKWVVRIERIIRSFLYVPFMRNNEFNFLFYLFSNTPLFERYIPNQLPRIIFFNRLFYYI